MNASETPPIPSASEELAAAMAWWRDAGVDCDFTDDVTVWLASPDATERQGALDEAKEARQAPVARDQVRAEPSPAPTTPRVDFFADAKPQTLEQFREFWLTAPGLDAIGARGRVPPRGSPGADLMVLVVDPEERDQDALLSGPQGRLIEKILSAMGATPDTAYIASALPRHTPMADTVALAASGLDKVLHHHIALAQPRQILAFGARLSPFIAENSSGDETSLRKSNYSAALPPTLASEGLESLIETPPLKARFWRRWMEWSAEK